MKQWMLRRWESVARRVRWAAERGEVYVEYTVLAAMAVLIILGAVQFFFGGISALFQRIGSALRGIG